PLIMTGPPESKGYFEQIDRFVRATLGDEAAERYEIIVDDPERVGQEIRRGLDEVREFRRQHGDAYYFNWRLTIEHGFQQPFKATHESMRALDINEQLPAHELAANLRRVFSGIVSGNVREDTIESIERHGPFEICGSARYMSLLDELLAAFVEQGRMKLARESYTPCYRVVR
ncbi:MAG: pyrimidine/purine nucleotide monophosphate nucleosidase domain-containing protein, partial [Woeseiaceae bacterium]